VGHELQNQLLVQRDQPGRSRPILPLWLCDADGVRVSDIDRAVEDNNADGGLGLLPRRREKQICSPSLVSPAWIGFSMA
jgi:hypothetical protein